MTKVSIMTHVFMPNAEFEIPVSISFSRLSTFLLPAQLQKIVRRAWPTTLLSHANSIPAGNRFVPSFSSN